MIRVFVLALSLHTLGRLVRTEVPPPGRIGTRAGSLAALRNFRRRCPVPNNEFRAAASAQPGKIWVASTLLTRRILRRQPPKQRGPTPLVLGSALLPIRKIKKRYFKQPCVRIPWPKPRRISSRENPSLTVPRGLAASIPNSKRLKRKTKQRAVLGLFIFWCPGREEGGKRFC